VLLEILRTAIAERLKGFEELVEIPLAQRYVNRPSLKTLLDGTLTKAQRDAAIARAVHRYGYSQREVADWLGLHYATLSRLVSRS
jgi:Trp operon repressor